MGGVFSGLGLWRVNLALSAKLERERGALEGVKLISRSTSHAACVSDCCCDPQTIMTSD